VIEYKIIDFGRLIWIPRFVTLSACKAKIKRGFRKKRFPTYKEHCEKVTSYKKYLIN